MNPQDLLDKVLVIIDKHLDQIKLQATTLTKDGPKGFTDSQAGTIDKYAKILLTMTKKTEAKEDEYDNLSDDELIAAAQGVLGDKNADETSE